MGKPQPKSRARRLLEASFSLNIGGGGWTNRGNPDDVNRSYIVGGGPTAEPPVPPMAMEPASGVSGDKSFLVPTVFGAPDTRLKPTPYGQWFHPKIGQALGNLKSDVEQQIGVFTGKNAEKPATTTDNIVQSTIIPGGPAASSTKPVGKPKLPPVAPMGSGHTLSPQEGPPPPTAKSTPEQDKAYRDYYQSKNR